jgi:CxxC motif-containing protein
MEIINGCFVPADAKLGDVVVENILNTGANVVTTRNVKL